MKRLFKWLVGLLGAVLLLLLVAAAGALIFIDPNDYRQAIADEVAQQTGRELQIEGEIELSLFPWLGLELGAMELGNAAGFAERPFARIEAAEARVKLLPLLRLQTEIDTVVLRGLRLNLERRADGASNWDDLAAGTVPAEAEQEPAPADSGKVEQILSALAIGGIVIEDAEVAWRDELAAQQLNLRGFNLASGEIRIGQPIPLELSGEVSLAQPEIAGSLRLQTEVTADPMAQRYRLAQLSLQAALRGATLPGGKLEVNVGGAAAVDLAAQQATLDAFTLAAAGMTLTVTARAEQILEQPSFSGEVSSNEFVPRQLLAELGIALPEMADPSAMGKAKLASRFSGGLEQASLSALAIQLDDSTFGGELSLANFAAPVIRYDLQLDGIDVDRYLPPPAETPTPVAEAPVAAGPVEPAAEPALPLALMRSLDVDGTLRVGKVKVMNLRSDTIIATLKGKGGTFRLHPLSAQLYQGSYSGDLGLDVSGQEPRISMDEKLSGVQSGPLLKDFMGKEYVTGEAEMAAKLSAVGLTPQAVRGSLNGEGSFRFKDGAVLGMNIGQQIRKAYAAYQKQPEPPEEAKATDFADLSGSFKVTDGLVTTSDLSARSPLFQVDGKGKVNLVSEKLDLRLDTVIVSDIRDATGERMGDLRGETIPVTIKGSFSEPKIGVDVASILEAKAKAALDKKKAELQAEIDRKKAEAEAELERRRKAAEEEAKAKLEAEKKKLEKELEKKLQQMLK